MFRRQYFRRIQHQLKVYAQRRYSRQQLLQLDSHALKDIGISRSDAVMEGRKPFWRV